ncbi:hypothetical protein ACEWY4_022615 [Coilia grayii]|uniref:Zinc finger DNA binding protein n=1 Tax=Coilia grayii TaxID=363190 RepID=A0ABD1J6M7_9TELE
MGDKRSREQSKAQKNHTFTSLVQDPDNMMDLSANGHTYAQTEITLLPDSAPTTPVTKRGKTEPTLSELQDNIVRLVAEKLKENADSLACLIKKNADSIESLKGSTEFLAKEVQSVKADVTLAKQVIDKHESQITKLEEKVNEMERYHRRWNLRLYGLEEMEGENVKDRVIDICKTIAQNENGNNLQFKVDVSHRIGQKKSGKTRAVIIRFTLRSTRDLVWKCAKGSDFLKGRKLKFGEDLTSKDKEARNLLWPQVEKARKEGKKAFIVGAVAMINKKEVRAWE